ncbi:eCIS core domain-containing protein [Sorangium sp. So ce131]|uniref:eCIS core domain-containing protein n=1 Tax=Sorangium sp. So ce131 TaxID=3133282 RepID=UPI003F641066
MRAAERSGEPLPQRVRDLFEPRFRYDFSRVRVHTGVEAASAARSVRARAYTIGRDIVFGSGEYAPATTEGQRLIAHELQHVVQQSGGAGPTLGEGSPRIARQAKPPEKQKGDDPANGEELPAKDTMAGSLVTRVVISLARKRVGFQTAVGMILGTVNTDLKPGTYELKPEPDKQRWVIVKPETKSGFRFDVTLEGANPWTLRYPETLVMDVQTGSVNEPKTWGEMHDGKGLTDPLWIYEGTKPNPVTGPDDFDSARYDIDYRSEKGNLSKWLVVGYRDNTTKDIHLDTITESTPRLWAAKQEALKVMGEYNLNFILGTFGTVFFIITITPLVGVPTRYGATRRAVPKSAGAKPPNSKPPEVKPPEVKPPEAKPPEVKPPEAKPPAVKAPETKTPATPKAPEPGKAGGPAAVKDPAQFGRDLGAKVKSQPSGKRAAIANGVSDANLSQADAAKATGEASKAAFGRIAEVPMPNGDTVVASVQSGPNQPVFVVKPDGKVIMARATIEPTRPLNLERPITVSDIVPE